MRKNRRGSYQGTKRTVGRARKAKPRTRRIELGPAEALAQALPLEIVGVPVTVPKGLRASEVEVARAAAPAGGAKGGVSAIVVWGDGTGPEPARVRWRGHVASIVASHQFPRPGHFGVTVRVIQTGQDLTTVTTRATVGSGAEQVAERLYAHLAGHPPDATSYARLAAHTADARAVVHAILDDAASREARVERTYYAVLRRPPTPAEKERANAALGRGASIAKLRARLLGSREYFRTMARNDIVRFVHAIYRDLLRRRPEASEVTAVREGATSDAGRVQAAERVMASQEAWIDATRRDYRAVVGYEPSSARLVQFAAEWAERRSEDDRIVHALDAVAEDILRPQNVTEEERAALLRSPDAADSTVQMNLIVELIPEEANEAVARHRATFEAQLGRSAYAAEFHLAGTRLTIGVWWAAPHPSSASRKAWLEDVSDADAIAGGNSIGFFTTFKFLNAAAWETVKSQSTDADVHLSSVVLEGAPPDTVVTKTRGRIKATFGVEYRIGFDAELGERLFVNSEGFTDCERVTEKAIPDLNSGVEFFNLTWAAGPLGLAFIIGSVVDAAGKLKATDQEGAGCRVAHQLPHVDETPLARLTFSYSSIDVLTSGILAQAFLGIDPLTPSLDIVGAVRLRGPTRFHVVTTGLRFLKRLEWSCSPGSLGTQTIAPLDIATPLQEAKPGQRILDPSTMVSFDTSTLPQGATATWTLSATVKDLTNIGASATQFVYIHIKHPFEDIPIEPPIPVGGPIRPPIGPWVAPFTRRISGRH